MCFNKLSHCVRLHWIPKVFFFCTFWEPFPYHAEWGFYVLHKLTCDYCARWLLEYIFNIVKSLRSVKWGIFTSAAKKAASGVSETTQFPNELTRKQWCLTLGGWESSQKRLCLVQSYPPHLTEVLPDGYLVQKTTRKECNTSHTAPVSLSKKRHL